MHSKPYKKTFMANGKKEYKFFLKNWEIPSHVCTIQCRGAAETSCNLLELFNDYSPGSFNNNNKKNPHTKFMKRKLSDNFDFALEMAPHTVTILES